MAGGSEVDGDSASLLGGLGHELSLRSRALAVGPESRSTGAPRWCSYRRPHSGIPP